MTLCGVNESIVCMTKWNPTLQISEEGNGKPKYQALADAIQRDIFAGRLNPGDKLPTHRDLADRLHINVSTVTRGYVEAERRNLVSGVVGRGTFVASDVLTNSAMVSFEPHAPGMIELGLIEPFYGLDPDIMDGMRTLLRKRSPESFMRYSDPRGLPEHRAVGAQWVGRYGLSAPPEQVIVCSGAQHGLTCCLTGLFKAGDRIAADALTYPGMKSLTAMLGVRLVPIPMDEHGMLPEGLDAACRRDAVKGLYLMPGMHNPTTISMPRERREALARVAQKHDLLLIEDDAYDLTVSNNLPPVSVFAPQNSVYIAGMSKSLAAGLRVAFLAAPEPLLGNLAHAVLNTVWMTPPLNAALACQWIQDGQADETIALKRREAESRFTEAKAMLSNFSFAGRPSGFYIWLKLPRPWTGRDFETAARKAGVNVFGAEKFAVGESEAPPMARISLSGPKDVEELRRGLEIVKELLE